MAKWWHTLATIGLAILGALNPLVQSAIVAHPTLGIVLGSIWAILGHLLPSPMAPIQ